MDNYDDGVKARAFFVAMLAGVKNAACRLALKTKRLDACVAAL